MNVLISGTRNLIPTELLRAKAKTTLLGLAPKTLITDFSTGWNEMILELSVELGIPLIGAIPFPPAPLYEQYRKRSRSSITFNETLRDYLASPGSYHDWLRENADAAIIYNSRFSREAWVDLDVTPYDLGEGGHFER